VPFERDFPAVASSLASIRAAVAEFAEQAAGSQRKTASVVQAVHEAAANAVIHGYGGGDREQVVGVAGTKEDGWLRFVVSDTGSGFRPSRTSPGYGLGLAIIAQLADELEIRDGSGGGLTVLIAFRLAG
jgi:anti-sigma regulatory factor (Ser/Thr protein kinase)